MEQSKGSEEKSSAKLFLKRVSGWCEEMEHLGETGLGAAYGFKQRFDDAMTGVPVTEQEYEDRLSIEYFMSLVW